MGFMVQALPADLGVLLLHSFSLSLLLEQALLVPTVVELLVSLAKPKAVVSIAIIPSDYLALESVALTCIVLSASSLLSYSLSNFYPDLLPTHTIV